MQWIPKMLILDSLLMVLASLCGSILAVPNAPRTRSAQSVNAVAHRDTTCTSFDSLTAPECWNDGYSLSTNWYDEGPDTGITREYWFEVTNTTAAPDGYERIVLSINGSIPGPTIYADWGDTVVVHVHNAMTDNGTSIHWHGIRQLQNSQHDGVASITQCPIAPGDSLTYTWRATQYGTTWYHSHFAVQAWNGVVGGIVIHGPASAPYTEDKGILFLSDWFHETTDALEYDAIATTAPNASNGLLNGTNVSPYGGSYFSTTGTAGDSYRLRLVNGALDTTFKFGIDNHTLTVIANDLVPIVPYETDFVTINIGQRYDVIVNADQVPGNYWMRALVQNCSSGHDMLGNITGIFHYDSVAAELPTSIQANFVDGCDDELSSNLVPYLAMNAGAADETDLFEVFHSEYNGLSWWTINDVEFVTDWGNPTLQQVADGVTSFGPSELVNIFDESNTWVYFVIQTTLKAYHPIHLHGHDFFVLGSGLGNFTDPATLQLSNPPRRDVAVLPGHGWLVIAWPQDNPGVWLLHCHIGWHTAQGLAWQLVEQVSDIVGSVDTEVVNETCANWNAYADKVDLFQLDSGI
ncbi:multicopper oxidase [Xylariaceae sp. FL1272]|nr:multicopper oxidase [Xylariaceae sp. FL1272]